MKIQPFIEIETEENDMEYAFIFLGEPRFVGHKKKYHTRITIDELADHLVIGKSCTCEDYIFRKRDCKHIKEAIRLLKENEVEMRDE